MTRTLSTGLPVAWAALLASTIAVAQAPGAGRGGDPARRDGDGDDASTKAAARPLGLSGLGGRGTITSVTLIPSKAVQDELKLTAAQKQKIAALNVSFQERRLEAARALTQDPQAVHPEALAAMIAGFRAENEDAIARVLEPRQRARLAQIFLRLEGPLAVARPEVADRLNLSPDQRENIQAVLDQFEEADARAWAAHLQRLEADHSKRKPDRAARGAAPAGRATDPLADRRAREVAALQDEAVRQVARLLTRKQKDAFRRLLGEPFDLAAVQPGGDRPRETVPAEGAPVHLEPIPAAASAGASPAPRPPEATKPVPRNRARP